MRIKRIAAAVLAAAAVATGASAHHSGAMFDKDKLVEIRGTVKEFQYTNPHSWLLVDAVDESGKTVTWGFEAEGPSTLMRAGIRKSTLAPGTKLLIRGNPMRDGRPAAAWTDAVLEDGTEINPRNGFAVIPADKAQTAGEAQAAANAAAATPAATEAQAEATPTEAPAEGATPTEAPKAGN